MPINEGVWIDDDTAITRALVEKARGDDTTYRRLAAERAEAERAAAEAAAREAARIERFREMGRWRKRKQSPGRPWQRAGFTNRADWEAAGSPR
jgi:hypothetical protein